MADRKQKWPHLVTQPRERKSKKNSTKTQQKQNALTKILITNNKWVRSTRLGTTYGPYKGHLLSADLRNRRCLPFSTAAIPQVRRPRWSGPEVDVSSSSTARLLCRSSSPQQLGQLSLFTDPASSLKTVSHQTALRNIMFIPGNGAHVCWIEKKIWLFIYMA